MIARLSLPLAVLALSSCHIHFDGTSTWTVDGVLLREEHTETITILEWHESGLAIDVAAGDVRVVATSGPTEIEATLHEVSPGDARLEYLEGKLVWRTESGEPAAIGDVTVRAGHGLAELLVQTGAGDIRVEDVAVLGTLKLSTGAGDVTVRGTGNPAESHLSTGMGDIRVASLTTPYLRASTGMGDLVVTGISSDRADLSTGMGDVDARESHFGRLEASTGMGDIDASTASYDEADLDTGMGDIERARG